MNKMKISTVFLSACVGFNAIAAESLEKKETLQRSIYSEDIKKVVDEADNAFKLKSFSKAIELIKKAKNLVLKVSQETPETELQLKDLNNKYSIVVFTAVDNYVLASKKTSTSQELENAKVLLQNLVAEEIQLELAEEKLAELEILLEKRSIEQRIGKVELQRAQEQKLNKTEPLLEQARLLYQNNRFDDCRTVIDQILIINPYHLEATRLFEKKRMLNFKR